MSHFSVMVIGDDVHKALAPFHEFECTGEDNEFVQNLDETDNLNLEEGTTVMDYVMSENIPLLGHLPEVFEGEAKFNFAMPNEAGELRVYRRTNPNAKWDWWQEGGRWGNMLLLKSGNKADFAFKGDIDIEGMRKEATDEAASLYDEVMAVVGNLDDFTSWEILREKYPEVEEAREVYHAQRAVVAKKDSALSPFLELEKFQVSREQFLTDASNRALQTFAFVKDGQWNERGDMGWFGMVADEKDPNDWEQQFATMFDALPDDTPITIVDCHI